MERDLVICILMLLKRFYLNNFHHLVDLILHLNNDVLVNGSATTYKLFSAVVVIGLLQVNILYFHTTLEIVSSCTA